MNRPRNFRVYFLLVVLTICALILLLREHRPSFLRPGLHLSAYVSTADGNVTVVDLVKLKAVARIPVGPGLSGVSRASHTCRDLWRQHCRWLRLDHRSAH